MRERFGPSLDHAVALERGGLVALVGAVEHRAVDELTLVVYLYLIGGFRHLALALRNDLVLHLGARDEFHARLLEIVCEELLAGLAVVAVLLLHELGVVVVHLAPYDIHGGVGLDALTLARDAGGKAFLELILVDKLGAILVGDTLVERRQDLIHQLLAYLDAGGVSSEAFVARLGESLTVAAHEVVHLGGVHTEALCEVGLESFGLHETHVIAEHRHCHGVDNGCSSLSLRALGGLALLCFCGLCDLGRSGLLGDFLLGARLAAAYQQRSHDENHHFYASHCFYLSVGWIDTNSSLNTRAENGLMICPTSLVP